MSHPMILGIDTASNQCAVCFKTKEGEYHPHALAMDYSHGAHLMGCIDQVLTSPQDLKAIAVTTGPGGFTGIRIGLATAKGLGLGYDVDVIGISCFSVWAAMTQKIWKGEEIAVILDTRRADFFVQIFSSPDHPKSDPQILSHDEVIRLCQNPSMLFAGDGLLKLSADVNVLDDSVLNIQILCDLAENILRQKIQKSYPAQALYIQPPQIHNPTQKI